MASLGPATASIVKVSYAQAALSASVPKPAPEPTAGSPPKSDEKPILELANVALTDGDSELAFGRPAIVEDERPQAAEDADEPIFGLPAAQSLEELEYDPQEAFDLQTQRITDLVERFEAFLEKLQEIVESVDDREAPTDVRSAAAAFVKEDEAERLLDVIETTAASLFEEASNRGQTGQTPPVANEPGLPAADSGLNLLL